MLKKSPGTQPKNKKDKVFELKKLQQKWIAEMKISKSSSAQQISAIPSKPSPLNQVSLPCAESVPNIVNKVDILTDNWCQMSQKSTDNINSQQNNLTTCKICMSQLSSPHVVVPCGHSFCEKCLVSRLEKLNTCANCHNPIQGHFPNVALSELLRRSQQPLNSNIKCPPDLKNINVSDPMSVLTGLDFDQDPSDIAKQY